MLEIGTVIEGKYKILSQIGSGGMSNVYLAINEKANKTWAIKEVKKQADKNFDVIRRSLVVEMELLKKIKHPNLPQIVDVIEDFDNLFIVMDYIEGITLEKILDQKEVIDQNEVVNWAIQLCDVLDFLHHQSPPIIYRDMKPGNVMLRTDGSVVLIDFGTAREFRKEKLEDTTCLGTRGYAAPEQFGGMGQTDARTDIYNLGATMYHLVTGHNPAKPPYEIYPIRHWREELSSGLEYIIDKCTYNNPDQRYQTVKELKFELQNYRKLDEFAIMKYKKYLNIFYCFFVATFLCLFSSLILWKAGNQEKTKEYQYLIKQAQKMIDEEQMLEKCMEAIRLDPTKEEAYMMIYEAVIEDGIMDDREEQRILTICTSPDAELDVFEKKNPKGFADFCYNCGNAYWYYYVHKEGRQTHAVNWYETAAKYYKNDKEKEIELLRSTLYLHIGNFYKKIVASQLNGSDAGMYMEYWSALTELKRINDLENDRDFITLYMYEEIVARSMEYARYLKEDGVSKEEVTGIYDEIRKDLTGRKKNATSNLLEEILYIEKLLAQADYMLVSSF